MTMSMVPQKAGHHCGMPGLSMKPWPRKSKAPWPAMAAATNSGREWGTCQSVRFLNHSITAFKANNASPEPRE